MCFHLIVIAFGTVSLCHDIRTYEKGSKDEC